MTTSKETNYLVYRIGSNASNQSTCNKMAVAIVRGRNHDEALRQAHEQVNTYANQHLVLVPESRARGTDWNQVLENQAIAADQDRATDAVRALKLRTGYGLGDAVTTNKESQLNRAKAATPYSIQSRIADRNLSWQSEGSGDQYATQAEALSILACLEPTNDDGDALEYRVKYEG